MTIKKSKIIVALMIATLSVSLSACGTGGEGGEDGDTVIVEKKYPLNITIFLDLSDRIEETKDGMPQREKDIALINHMIDQFKKRAQRLKIQPCKDRMQVLFHPTPEDAAMNSCANDLTIDMGTLSKAEKRPKLIQMDSVWIKALNSIYTKAIEAPEFPGSDIWGFFKEDVKLNCIKQGYRNIVIFLTDGYIYYEGNNYCQDGACTWIAGSDGGNTLNTNLLIERNDLQDLEVMFLELTPHAKRYPIVQKTIETWLHGMGVEKTTIYKTGLPTHITPIIDDFIQWEQ